MFIRNIMNGKSYAKATMEPYLGNIAELSVDSKETRELTYLMIGALTYLAP